MPYAEKKLREGVYVPRPDSEYPTDDPHRRLLAVEVENSEEGRYRFDDTFPYRDRSFRYRLNWIIGWPFEWLLVTLINRIKWGLKVEGRSVLRKHRKALRGGAVAVCNHMTTFDAICANQALRPFRRMRIPMYAKHFNGSKSWFMRYCGGIPVPEDRKGMRKFNEAFDWYHEHGDWILVFPEAVRWDLYQPIRPFFKGAFTMAYKYNCPLVPCVITYRERKGLFRYTGARDLPLLTVRICEPVLPNPGIPRKEDVRRMLEEAHAKMCDAAGILVNPWSAAADESPR